MVTLSDQLHLIEEIVGSHNYASGTEMIEIYQQNVTQFAAKNLLAIVTPDTVGDLKRLVSYCAEAGVCYYPISTGLNWGLGSKIPTGDSCLVIDLKKLNNIRLVNEDLRFAIIEPGVTQVQLANYLSLNGFCLTLHSTGSAPKSSYIGNLLERGTTFNKPRYAELRGLEVVLPNGELVRSGFWNESNAKRSTFHYGHGVGPDITGLFLQSNLGIVTAAAVSLDKTPEISNLVVVHVENEEFPVFINKVKEAFEIGIFDRTVHIGNSKRMKITSSGFETKPIWSLFCSISGNARLVKSRMELAKDHFSDYKMQVCTQSDMDSYDVNTQAIFKLHLGEPQHIFLQAMHASYNSEPYVNDANIDSGNIGMLCCLPMLPLEGSSVVEAIKIVETVCNPFGIEAAITINPINDLYAEAVINIYFDRKRKDEVTNAHECNSLLHDRLFEEGFRFYRLDINEMSKSVSAENSFWGFVKTIKNAVDPQNLLSPSRYNL